MDKLGQQALELFGIRLTQAQLDAYQRYQELLLEWNKVHNLTAIREAEGVRTKHFLDSLSCLTVMRGKNGQRVIDVGTGAGFPGLVLKIAAPQIQLTLVESVAKKLEFCRLVTETLRLDGVTTIIGRAEELGQNRQHREAYDWAVARAVANMPVLAEYLLPLVKVGGAMLAMKGDTAPAETHAAAQAFKVLGGHVRKLIPVELPGVAEQRFLVVVDKIVTTPPGYPRRTGLPAKRPLENPVINS